MCPRSLLYDPFYTVHYYTQWIKTSWTYSITIGQCSIDLLLLHISGCWKIAHFRFLDRLEFYDRSCCVEIRETSLENLQKIILCAYLAPVFAGLSVVLLLDGNSDHVAHASRKIGLFEEIKSDL